MHVICAHAFSFPYALPPYETPPMEDKRVWLEIATTHPESAKEWYGLALLQIEAGKWADARLSLRKAIQLDPHFVKAYLQLGYLDFWEEKLEEAREAFLHVLQEKSCNYEALHILRKLADKWSSTPGRECDALELYELIYGCRPRDTDLLFYLGKTQAQMGQWKEAEITLQACLHQAPHYKDAILQLGTLYIWEERWEEAQKTFEKLPKNTDAQRGLGQIAERQGDLDRAGVFYHKALEIDPENTEAKRRLARLFLSKLRYRAAKPLYQQLVQEQPSLQSDWASLFEVKSHTNFSLWIETVYTDAKENDPTLNAPVVKDYYFLNAVHLWIPLLDRWRIDLKEIYYHQRENDIYPPTGVNYSMFLNGGQLTSTYFFAPDWKWDITARSFQAHGRGQMVYPFVTTVRFEPGTLLLYQGERQMFVADAHVESFVIKNYAQGQSELLRTDVIEGAYGLHIDFRPEIRGEGWLGRNYYHDNLDNWKTFQHAWVWVGAPSLKNGLSLLYHYEHSHFKTLSPNYYSYQRQIRNTIGAKIHFDFRERGYFEATYEHRWQTSYNLSQPIGSFLFTAAKQVLIANKITPKIGYRLKDLLRLELEGHYYRDNLPYRDWNLTSSLLLEF